MIRTGVILLTFMFVFSCKNDTKNDNQVIENSVVETPKELVVKLGFKTSVKDEFRIMLNNIEIDEFQKKNILIRETVPVSSGFESVVANFGTGNISNNLSISLGRTPKKVLFNGIEISYGEQLILITKSNFNKFFKTNKYIEFNEDNFGLRTKTLDGTSIPVIYAKESLLNHLIKTN